MKKYILLLSAFVALISCDRGSEIQPTVPTREVSIEAVATRTIYDGKNVVWESGDEVSVFFRHPESGFNVTPFSTNIEEGKTAAKARFSGSISAEVSRTSGYEDFGYAIYPTSVAVEGGSLVYDLPQTQTAEPNGSFQSGLNLASSVISLSDIEDDGSASAYFRNALAYIRINLTEDVKSVTVTGTDPLTGKAPLFVLNDENDDNHGRLVVDSSCEWASSSTSVKLLPANGQNFTEGTYNLLIWPGVQEGLTVTLEFNNIGNYDKVSKISTASPFTFVAGKYYTMTVNNTEELVLKEVNEALDGVEEPKDDPELTDDINALLAQVQSVTLMSEYLDNAAYAKYCQFTNGLKKLDIQLDYIVRPESAAEALVEAFKTDPTLVSGLLHYEDTGGNTQYADLSVNDLIIKEAGFGKYVTAMIEATNIPKQFYDGIYSASVALNIKANKTDVLSDFANLHPKIGAALDFTRSEDIPVLKGSIVSIPFKYAINGDSYVLSSPNEREGRVRITNHDGLFSGIVNVNIFESDLASQSVTIVLTSGDDVIEQELTFADAGKFDISYLSTVDYVGGEVNVFVDKSESYGAYTMTLSNNSVNTEYESKVGNLVKKLTYYNTWIYEKSSGVQGTYFIDENGPTKATVTGSEGTDIQLEVNNEGRNQRTAYLNFEIKNSNPAVNGDLTYRRSISITQKAYNTGFDESQYYSSGTVLTLKKATSNTNKHLNLVILGDGYKKAHLLKTGTFEGSARSAADVFLNAIDSDFRDRFNVYALVRESSNSGVASDNLNGQRYTYYETFWKNPSVGISETGKNNVKNDVKSICSEGSFDYYRTVAIVLMNSNADRGASDYEFGTESTSNVGDGYASFGYTMVPAYSTGTNGLIRHEGVGHCLGRLGDEYPTDHHTVSLVNERHGYGFYRNIATDTNYWSAFRNADYTAEEVDYVNYFDENGNVVKEGLYRSVNNKGIMFNNNGTFNAVSRWAIYERIRKQTEGPGNYWNDFLNWDKKNR